MAWSIRSESAPLTLDWYLSLHLTPSEIARVKRRRDWGEIQAALIAGIRQMDPTAARALARRQGLLPALTDRQHTAVVRHTAQKPAQARSNPRRRPNTARAMQELQGRLGALLGRSRNPYRANASDGEEFGYEVNVAAAWQQSMTSIYKTADLIVVATREALQNGVDAIRGRFKNRTGGMFSVDWETASDGSITISWTDNGTGMESRILRRFVRLADSPKREEAEGVEARVGLGDSIKATYPGAEQLIKTYNRKEGDGGSYWFLLNGLYQLKRGPLAGETLKKDYVFNYITSGPSGGFGQAKAVILGISDSFDWEVVTNDLLLKGAKMGEKMRIAQAPTPIQGTRITVRDVSSGYLEQYDEAAGKWLGLNDRLYNMLAATLTDNKIEIRLNGQTVKPYFGKGSGRRGIGMDVTQYGDWGTSGVPGAYGYPFNNGRDRLQYSPAEALENMARDIKREGEGNVRVGPQDEFYDPGGDKGTEARKMAQDLGAGLDDPAIDQMIREASASMVGFFEKTTGEMLKKQGQMAATSAAPGRAVEQQGGMGAPGLPEGVMMDPTDLPPGAVTLGGAGETILENDDVTGAASDLGVDGVKARRPSEGEKQVAKETVERVAGNLIDFLEAGDAVSQDAAEQEGTRFRPALDYDDKERIELIRRTGAITAEDIDALADVVEKAAEQATGANTGGGLQQVMAVQEGVKDLIKYAIPQDAEAAKAKKKAKKDDRFNPFGSLAGLIINKEQFLNSKGKYDSARARRFKQNFGKWLPYLLLWDAVCRLVTVKSGGKVQQSRGLTYKPGFVLNDDVLAVYHRFPTTHCVLINPFKMQDAAKGFKSDSLAFAAYIHSIAVHECTHMFLGTMHSARDSYGNPVESHGNEFATLREYVGNLTSPFLPVIAALSESYLGKERGINMSPRITGLAAQYKTDAETAKQEATKQIKKLEKRFATQKTKYTKQIDMLKAQSKVSCKTCYADLLKVLDGDGRLDTLDWLSTKTGR